MATRPSLHGAFAELQRRQEAELRQRQQASTILTPEQIGARTGISTARLLQTTLGGQLRAITADDLKVFKDRSRELGKQFREGLTARDIVNMSAPADRERARDQIGAAIPTRLTAGAALFTTPAGPGSKVTRHMVTVTWPGYGAAVSWPGTPLQAAKVLAEQPLKVDCDCDHFRYRLRHVVTVLGANAGRPETGFPKIRNPHLIGIACKHVLRVMVALESAGVRAQLAQMIAADRKQLESPGARKRVITTTSAQADRIASAKPKAIRTTSERDAMRLRAAVTKALPARSGDGVAAELSAALAQLSKRTDVTAATLLAAVKLVQQQGARP